jgi:hypothetical protein
MVGKQIEAAFKKFKGWKRDTYRNEGFCRAIAGGYAGIIFVL